MQGTLYSTHNSFWREGKYQKQYIAYRIINSFVLLLKNIDIGIKKYILEGIYYEIIYQHL